MFLFSSYAHFEGIAFVVYSDGEANLMRIRTIKIVAYKGIKIYIRNFGQTFEFLMSIDGNVYATHITATKPLWKRALGIDYSIKELDGAAMALISMAESVIDEQLGED